MEQWGGVAGAGAALIVMGVCLVKGSVEPLGWALGGFLGVVGSAMFLVGTIAEWRYLDAEHRRYLPAIALLLAMGMWAMWVAAPWRYFGPLIAVAGLAMFLVAIVGAIRLLVGLLIGIIGAWWRHG